MGNDLSIWTLVLDASPVVQAVMLLLMIASVASWAVIFAKGRVISSLAAPGRSVRDGLLVGRRPRHPVPQHRDQAAGRAPAMQSIFESGFGEFSRLRQPRHAGGPVARGGTARDAGCADA